MHPVPSLFSKLFRLSLCAALAGALSFPLITSAAPANGEQAVNQDYSKQKVVGILYELSLPKEKAGKSKEKKQLANTAYLLVSIHVTKSDFYPMSALIRKAFNKADTLAVEADVTDEIANRSNISKLSYVAPDKLQDHLTLSTWKNLEGMTGEAAQRFQSYKPVMVAMGLTISAGFDFGFDPKQNIEAHFLNAAKAEKKDILQLVGVAYQGDVLGGLSDAEGDAILASTLDSFRRGEVGNEFKNLERAWKSGDAEALAILTEAATNRDAGSKKMMSMLMADRNEDIANKLKQSMLDGKKMFAIVGAGHFVSESNLLELLKKQGLQVKQVR